MTTPTSDRSHVVATWRDQDGQRWWHLACTCGATFGSPTSGERDAAAEPHRQAHREYLERTAVRE